MGPKSGEQTMQTPRGREGTRESWPRSCLRRRLGALCTGVPNIGDGRRHRGWALPALSKESKGT